MAPRQYPRFLIFISAIYIIVTSGQLNKTRNLVLAPQDVDATSGKVVNLQCVFDSPADTCYWTKDGHLVNETLLQFTGRRQDGDCSVAFDAQNTTHGRWQCGLPTTSTHEGVLSQNVHVKIAGFVDEMPVRLAGAGAGPITPRLKSPDDFITEPANTTVRSGDNVILKCVFKIVSYRNTEHCYWEKGGDNGNVVEIVGRYAFVADRGSGDCSLSITNANFKLDNGIWQCGIPQAESAGIKSKQATLTVAVAPKDPKILRDGVEQPIGSDLGVEFNQDLNLFCQSAFGNPAAQLQWTLNGNELPGTDEVVREMLLWTARNHLIQRVTDNWRDQQLRCTAIHPSYDDGHEHSTYVTIRQTQVTQIANIVCQSSDDPSRTVTLKADEKADFNCLADGLPKPEYRWQTRKDDTDQWRKLVDNIQNLTVLGSGESQEIRCTASNNKFASQAYSVHWKIIDPSSNNAVAGLHVGLASLIMTCIIVVATWN